MKPTPVTEWVTRYLATIVAELVAVGVGADDIERAVELTIVDLHSSHPAATLEVVDVIRANTLAAVSILRGDSPVP